MQTSQETSDGPVPTEFPGRAGGFSPVDPLSLQGAFQTFMVFNPPEMIQVEGYFLKNGKQTT